MNGNIETYFFVLFESDLMLAFLYFSLSRENPESGRTGSEWYYWCTTARTNGEMEYEWSSRGDTATSYGIASVQRNGLQPSPGKIYLCI